MEKWSRTCLTKKPSEPRCSFKIFREKSVISVFQSSLSSLSVDSRPDPRLLFRSRARSKSSLPKFRGNIRGYGRRHESFSRQASRQALGGHRRKRPRTIPIVSSFFICFLSIFLFIS